MNDITKHYKFHRLLVEASNYRVLCHLLKADPEVTPGTVALVRNVIASIATTRHFSTKSPRPDFNEANARLARARRSLSLHRARARGLSDFATIAGRYNFPIDAFWLAKGCRR